jgi:c-di-GMP-binding flagellar brake protein YcgR
MEEKGMKPRFGIVNFERRKHPRFNIDLPVEYYLIPARIGGSGQAINVSEGGLLVYFTERVEIGQHLQLKLFFPSGSELKTIEMVTEVVWVDIHLGKDWGDFRSGLRFVDISADNMNRLKAFLRSLSE